MAGPTEIKAGAGTWAKKKSFAAMFGPKSKHLRLTVASVSAFFFLLLLLGNLNFFSFIAVAQLSLLSVSRSIHL